MRLKLGDTQSLSPKYASVSTIPRLQEDVVVIEDDQVGVEAAKAAGMACLVRTLTPYTRAGSRDADKVTRC